MPPATVVAMTAAFAVAAAVAVVAIVLLVLTARRTGAAVAAERSRADQLEAELGSAREARSEVEDRLHQDDLALGAAVEGADVSELRATTAEGRLAAADTLWELERLRLEREWREVTGTPVPLPQPWDGSIRAAIAVELEIIREVIGIPTRLEPGDPAAASEAPGPVAAAPDPEAVGQDPVATLGVARLSAEVLRSLARVGEELVVVVEPEGSVTMAVATEGTGPEPNLGRLPEAATSLGGDLALRPIAGGFEARFRLAPQSAGA
jgi:hypothetical protein